MSQSADALKRTGSGGLKGILKHARFPAAVDHYYTTVCCPSCGREVMRHGHADGEIRACVGCGVPFKQGKTQSDTFATTMEAYMTQRFPVEPEVRIGGRVREG